MHQRSSDLYAICLGTKALPVTAYEPATEAIRAHIPAFTKSQMAGPGQAVGFQLKWHHRSGPAPPC